MPRFVGQPHEDPVSCPRMAAHTAFMGNESMVWSPNLIDSSCVLNSPSHGYPMTLARWRINPEQPQFQPFGWRAEKRQWVAQRSCRTRQLGKPAIFELEIGTQAWAAARITLGELKARRYPTGADLQVHRLTTENHPLTSRCRLKGLGWIAAPIKTLIKGVMP